MTRITVDNVEQIAMSLSLFGERETSDVLRKALRDVCKRTAEKAKSNINHQTGTLRQSIKVRAGKRERGSISRVVISDGSGKDDAYYGAFVELGHKAGKRSLKNRKDVPPHPFLRPAFDDTKDQAIRDVMDALDKQIEQFNG